MAVRVYVHTCACVCRWWRASTNLSKQTSFLPMQGQTTNRHQAVGRRMRWEKQKKNSNKKQGAAQGGRNRRRRKGGVETGSSSQGGIVALFLFNRTSHCILHRCIRLRNREFNTCPRVCVGVCTAETGNGMCLDVSRLHTKCVYLNASCCEGKKSTACSSVTCLRRIKVCGNEDREEWIKERAGVFLRLSLPCRVSPGRPPNRRDSLRAQPKHAQRLLVRKISLYIPKQ